MIEVISEARDIAAASEHAIDSRRLFALRRLIEQDGYGPAEYAAALMAVEVEFMAEAVLGEPVAVRSGPTVGEEPGSFEGYPFPPEPYARSWTR